MRPLERPATVSPDISRFISAPDPEELLEAEEIDETPYVPHVPLKPPPPPRFANRRKLFEDTDGAGQSDFGDGILQDPAGESDSENDASDLKVQKNQVAQPARRDPNGAKAARPAENTNRDRNRSRRQRGRSGSSDSAGPSRHPVVKPAPRPDVGDAGISRATPKLSDDSPSTLGASSAQGHPEVDQAEKSGTSESTGSGGPRRSRRRGRRRGPRPEGGHA